MITSLNWYMELQNKEDYTKPSFEICFCSSLDQFKKTLKNSINKKKIQFPKISFVHFYSFFHSLTVSCPFTFTMHFSSTIPLPHLSLSNKPQLTIRFFFSTLPPPSPLVRWRNRPTTIPVRPPPPRAGVSSRRDERSRDKAPAAASVGRAQQVPARGWTAAKWIRSKQVC